MGNGAAITAVHHNVFADKITAGKLFKEIYSAIPVFSPRVVDKDLVLYGAGKLGKMAKEYFDYLKIHVAAVVDKCPEMYRNDVYWQKMHVVDPASIDDTMKKRSLVAICITTVPLSEIQYLLAQSGWIDVVPFYDITEAYRAYHPLGNGWFSGPFDQLDKDNIHQTLDSWSDDVSRAHHLQFIAWHCLRQEWRFQAAPVNVKDRYFIPEILAVLKNDEVFWDIGAFHGETTYRFLQKMHGHYKEICIFEPDAQSRTLMLENLKEWQVMDTARIKVLPYAVSDICGSLPFASGKGYASQIAEDGDDNALTVSIDSLDMQPTFLKMHLEGHEYRAIVGGLKSFQRFRPILAVTVYHNRLGMWNIPLLLMQNLNKYRFLFRQHGFGDTGAVMYAIPEERSAT